MTASTLFDGPKGGLKRRIRELADARRDLREAEERLENSPWRMGDVRRREVEAAKRRLRTLEGGGLV